MQPNRQLVVMIGSTIRDLPDHREQVMNACLDVNCLPKMMEHMAATDSQPVSESIRLVDEADIYIGIFAHRYGFVPDGYSISITQMEYERAVERGIPRLIFLMHPDHQMKVGDIEVGEGAERLQELKDRLEKELVVKYFRSAVELRAQVVGALATLRAGHAGTVTPPLPPTVREHHELPAGSGLRVQRKGLFRIETRTGSANDRLTLTVNIGFFRVWLKNTSGRRLPLVCGCAIARSIVNFNNGRSATEPNITLRPNETRAEVEFGTGTNPIVRVETVAPKMFLEGRIQIVFDVDQSENGFSETMTVPALPSGVVRVRPDWFEPARPQGVSALEQPLPDAIRILVNALLERSFRSAYPAQKFVF